MEFDFSKFVDDIEVRKQKLNEKKKEESHVIEQDRLRRLRAAQYHERWQNRIVWSNN